MSANPSPKPLPIDTKESEQDIHDTSFEVSKVRIKRTKPKIALRNKKSKKEYVKSRTIKKEQDKISVEDTIIEEEDSLHATMDLGGTTIPAEPLKFATT